MGMTERQKRRAMAEPNETTEFWRDVRHARQEDRQATRDAFAVDVDALVLAGYTVRKVDDYCWRVNGALDLYGTRRRYHHLPTGRRGRLAGDTLAAVARLLDGGM